jgi:hypothetical protein
MRSEKGLTVSGLEAQGMQHLNRGEQEGQSLSGTSLRSTEHIPSGKQRRNGTLLNLGHGREAHVVDTLHGLLGKVELRELLQLALSLGQTDIFHSRKIRTVHSCGVFGIIALLRIHLLNILNGLDLGLLGALFLGTW